MHCLTTTKVVTVTKVSTCFNNSVEELVTRARLHYGLNVDQIHSLKNGEPVPLLSPFEGIVLQLDKS